ncbi:MAG: glycosyltransferase family 2 protein [Planctomycetota bacterium]|nr:glycosyltransferase family 2 protein [Planctomycetota bacterium]
MKLIVQIPCFNEEETLPQTVADIPRDIPGIDVVEVMIIDDGSSDRTIEVAKEIGVDHIVRHIANRGLARTFRTGLDAAVRLGADIVVNTDGDNQYSGADIPKLVAPILERNAQIVVGDRQTDTIEHFSGFKKFLQRFGSGVVRRLSETDVTDTVSGFRAFSRDAALQLNIVSPFSYTIETVIQAGKKGIAISSVPIGTNAKTRESRLFKSVPDFVKNSGATIVRMYSMYQPLRVFFFISLALVLIGLLPVIRFLFFYLQGDGSGHIQSLILGGVLLIAGCLAAMIGLVADLISFNRQLIELTLEKVRRIELILEPEERKSN